MARTKQKLPPRAPPTPTAPARAVEFPRAFYRAALAVVLLVAAALRIWAARGELWIDELWSLNEFAGTARSPVEIFTFHHDNNHYLTTLWMYLLGTDREPWIVYRLPSLVTGIGTVALLAWAARRWGTMASLLAALVGSVSLMLVEYASEARGYAPAGFFALAAFIALDRYLRQPRAWIGAAFGAASILGILSHLTFVEFTLAAIVWSAVRYWRIGIFRSASFQHLTLLHAVPLLLIATLYVVDIQQMQIGGGKAAGLWQVIVQALALAVGAPPGPLAVALVAGAAAIALVGIALTWLARERDDAWVFFIVMVFVAPALALVAQRSSVLFERYFYLNMLFLQMLLAFLLARAVQRGGVGRAVAAGALALLVVGNAFQSGELLRLGRGRFVEVLQYLVDHSDQPQVHICNDGRRNQVVMYTEFYRRRIQNAHFVFDRFSRDMPDPPEWFVTTSQSREYHPPQRLPLRSGRTYLLERVFPFAGLSGFHFAVYHLEGEKSRHADNDARATEKDAR